MGEQDTELNAREQGLSQREAALHTREAKLQAREDALCTQETAFQTREDDIQTQETALKDWEKELRYRENELYTQAVKLEHREIEIVELERREEQVSKREARLSELIDAGVLEKLSDGSEQAHLSQSDALTYSAFQIYNAAEDERLFRAIHEPLQIVGPLSVGASIRSAGGTVYKVTLSSCTCSDFRRRRAPCKHMYRLAMQYGLLLQFNDVQQREWLGAVEEKRVEMEEAEARNERRLSLIKQENEKQLSLIRQENEKQLFLTRQENEKQLSLVRQETAELERKQKRFKMIRTVSMIAVFFVLFVSLVSHLPSSKTVIESYSTADGSSASISVTTPKPAMAASTITSRAIIAAPAFTPKPATAASTITVYVSRNDISHLKKTAPA